MLSRFHMFSSEESDVSPRRNEDEEEDTFLLDEDTLPDLNRVDAVALKIKNKRRRRKRASESPAQPRFSDTYQLTDDPYLGCGSYGSVFQCTHYRNANEEFAVKIIEKKGHSRKRLFDEIEILHQCKGHPNIIQLLDFIEEEDQFFLVFEKVNGGPLLDHIAERGVFSEREASLVVKDISKALDFLHRKGIAHRDLKPANILCVHGDTASPVKICDFDLASAPWTREGNHGMKSPDLVSPVGSAEYMAPEVVNLFIGQAAVYDKRCDMWSLGVIMYILLCGFPPFVGRCGMDCGWNEGESCSECQSLLMESISRGVLTFPDESWGNISDEAKHLVSHLLERDADKRFCPQTVLEHPWINKSYELSESPIDIPCGFKRTNSTYYMSDVTDHLVATNRILSQAQILHEDRPRLNTDDSGFDGGHTGYLSSIDASGFSLGPFDISDDEGQGLEWWKGEMHANGSSWMMRESFTEDSNHDLDNQ